MTNNTPDAGIPMLTEIIQTPAVANAPAAAPEPPAQENIAVEHTVTTGADIVLNDVQWERLEREVRERVLTQVLERIDVVLEHRVRDSLADALQTAVGNLAADLRVGLRHSIGDVVSRAVTQEIAKLQSTKK